MAALLATTTAQKLPVGQNQRPILQNLGTGLAYFGDSSSVSATNGIQLAVGAAFEFPTDLSNAGWAELWVVSAATSDLRYFSVGHDQNDM